MGPIPTCGTASHSGDVIMKISNTLWVIQYELEHRRMRYSIKGALLRQAWTCIGLALLKMAGVNWL